MPVARCDCNTCRLCKHRLLMRRLRQQAADRLAALVDSGVAVNRANDYWAVYIELVERRWERSAYLNRTE